MELPAFIDRELWEAFCEVRRAMGKRAPFTERAQRLILRDLERFHDWGYNPNLSLEESIKRGWRGVFPQGERQMRDKQGNRYRITAEGFREFIQ